MRKFNFLRSGLIKFISIAGNSPLSRWIPAFLRFPMQASQMMLLRYYKDDRVLNVIKKIRKEKDLLLWNSEAYLLYSCVKNLKVSGDVAEVGVYQGASAKLMHIAMGDRILHAFDTFQGLPGSSAYDSHLLTDGLFLDTLENVKKYLGDGLHIRLYKGIFPSETGHLVEKNKFAFVHLDTDLYEGTKKSLEFFYPLIPSGGAIIIHDYTHLDGVKKATDEFFSDKPEFIIDLPTSQCLIIKL